MIDVALTMEFFVADGQCAVSGADWEQVRQGHVGGECGGA
jgi:hypothetical protein